MVSEKNAVDEIINQEHSIGNILLEYRKNKFRSKAIIAMHRIVPVLQESEVELPFAEPVSYYHLPKNWIAGFCELYG